MSQPLVICLRDAFDITIRQTIKRYYRLQQLELRFVLQIEWCITHHFPGVMLMYERTSKDRKKESSIYWNNSSMHWNEIFNLLRCQVERVLEAVSGFTNHFSSSFEDNELYFCLSVCLLNLAYLRILLRLMTLATRLLQTSLTHF